MCAIQCVNKKLPTVPVLIENKVAVNALIDPCASYSLMQSKVCKNAKCKLEPTARACGTISKEPIEILGEACIQVTIEGKEYPVKFLVVQQLVEQVILGADLFDRTNQLTIKYQGGKPREVEVEQVSAATQQDDKRYEESSETTAQTVEEAKESECTRCPN